MKKIISIVVAGWMGMHLMAQDMDVTAQRDIQGSARYIGMAGAMTAVGGDPSAVMDNPGGLGVYRRSEATVSLGAYFDRRYQATQNNALSKTNRMTISQAALIFNFSNPHKDHGLLANNVMVSYQRLADYSREYTAKSMQPENSLAGVIATKTNGLTESEVSEENRWYNEDVGWLSCQGYDTWLISPATSGSTQWVAVNAGDAINNQIRVQETGSANQYGLSWGGNINDKLYLGASLNVLSYYRRQWVLYLERFGDECSLQNDTYFSQSTIGVNGVVGLIYHPWQWLRIGASFQTPGALSTTTINYGTLHSILYFNNEETGKKELRYHDSPSMENCVAESHYVMPMRVSSGIAFQCLQYGLISLQYDYAHSSATHDVHALKVGVEGVIANNYFLNAGYAYESLFAHTSPQVLVPTTVRTDANSQYITQSQYGSLAFGYRNNLFTAQAAYQFRWQTMDSYAHENVCQAYTIDAMTHRIVVTIGFHW